MTRIDKRTRAQRLRADWAATLAEAMSEWGDPETGLPPMTPQRLRIELERVGVKVSEQTIYAWLRADDGGWSPRPEHQGAVAFVLGKKVRELFPIEAVAS